MRTSEATDLISVALCKARAEMKPPVKNCTGKVSGTNKAGKYYEYEYKYADYGALLAVALPPLHANGIVLLQPPCGGKLETRLELAGQFYEGDYELPTNCTPQQMGSAISYGKRYSLAAMLGISAEDDDDGAVAEAGDATHEAPEPESRNGMRIALDDAQRDVVDKLMEHRAELCATWEPDADKRRARVFDLTGRIFRSTPSFEGFVDMTREEEKILFKMAASEMSTDIDKRNAA